MGTRSNRCGDASQMTIMAKKMGNSIRNQASLLLILLPHLLVVNMP